MAEGASFLLPLCIHPTHCPYSSQRVSLPYNETQTLIDVGEPGTYEFRVGSFTKTQLQPHVQGTLCTCSSAHSCSTQVICNSSIGQTNFSTPALAAVEARSACVGSDLECNPNYIYAIVFPAAALVGIVIVGVAIFIIVKVATKKASLPP